MSTYTEQLGQNCNVPHHNKPLSHSKQDTNTPTCGFDSRIQSAGLMLQAHVWQFTVRQLQRQLCGVF